MKSQIIPRSQKTGMGVGWSVGWILGLACNDRRVFAIEFAIRNLGAVILVASSTLGRPEFLTFWALLVVVQFPMVTLFLQMSAWKGGASYEADG